MNYHVARKPHAEEQLAAIWIEAADRRAVTAAADVIDRLLRTDASSAGESRSGKTRALVVPPLGVHFEVHEEDCLVYVLTVHYSPQHRREG
jgi:hypothetical protein